MLLTNRLFTRQPPSREAKSLYIFCEGAKREVQYFRYFREMDSRINIEVYQLKPGENNSPIGLLNIAKSCVIPTKENPAPKYRFQENDEVWIILDIDPDKAGSRKPQIRKVKAFCKENKDWQVLQSNPCFEVWLYYHLYKDRPEFEGDDKCANWKQFVGTAIKGGFHSSRHPIFIQDAINNAKENFDSENNEPKKGCTEIFILGKSIITILKNKIEKVLKEIEE